MITKKTSGKPSNTSQSIHASMIYMLEEENKEHRMQQTNFYP